MINPVWLVSFVEVVNRSSMAAAAKHLRITPAAISKHILNLENELEIQLLQRSTRRIALTHEGRLYFEHAKSILSAYKEAENAISYSKEEPSGTLKIVCGPQIGNLFVIPHLKEFLSRYPKIRLNIMSTQTMPDLEKEKVDVIVGLTSGIPSYCIQRVLTYARWIFCASPDYLEKFGEPKKPSDLVKHQIITRVQRQPNNVIEFKKGKPIIFEPYIYYDDTRAIRKCALEGLGIVQLHDYIVAQDLKENRLVEILSKYTELKKPIPVSLYYFPASHVHLKVRCFVDFMVEIMCRYCLLSMIL